MIAESSITLHPGQKRIIKSVLSNPVMYNSINASRQFGKSILGREIAQYLLFNCGDYEKRVLKPRFPLDRCNIIWTSPTISQAKKVYKELEDALRPALRYWNKTDRLLITINGSRIQFFGVDKPDNIRGDNCHYMICDEYAFYKQDVFNTVLRPFLAVTGKMVFFISTPNGLNDFYKLKERGISSEFPRYKYVEGIYTENPYYNIEEVEDARKTLPLALFEQEYLAKFVGGGASVFGDYEKLMIIPEWSNPIDTMEYYSGTDVAKQKDWTVTTTIDKNHKVSNILRTRRVNWQVIIDSVINNLQDYKSYAFIEVNGVGDPIFDLIRNQYNQVYSFVTNNQTKQMIIQNLIAAIETGSIKLPTKDLFPALYEEMSTFTFDYSPEKRQIVYKAMEGFHDDTIISLALANMQYKRFNR